MDIYCLNMFELLNSICHNNTVYICILYNHCIILLIFMWYVRVGQGFCECIDFRGHPEPQLAAEALGCDLPGYSEEVGSTALVSE